MMAASQSPFGAAVRPTRATASLLPILTMVAALWVGLLAHDWKAGASILLLWVAWHYLPRVENSHVLFFAFLYQWAQVSLGIIYKALSGRSTPFMLKFDPGPMFLIGLLTLIATLAGLRFGFTLIGGAVPPPGSIRTPSMPWPLLRNLYLIFAFLNPILTRLAFRLPQITQFILVISYIHYVLMLLVLYRLLKPTPRWGLVAAVLLGEVAFGFTSYFANFREAEVLGALASFDNFKTRKASYWIALLSLGSLIFASATVWTAIKPHYRFALRTRDLSGMERLELVGNLSGKLTAEDMGKATDKTVDRLWAIYYPALALERVPQLVPYQNGAIVWGALDFALKPRWLFPGKGILPSDSEEVRKYSGVMVAGARQNTSIAFGYAGESYVDYGVPEMFLPIFLFAFFMGFAYAWISRQIRHRDLAVTVTTVIFWLSLYQFEMAWVKRIGLAGNLLIFLTVVAIFSDRLLLRMRRARMAQSYRQGSHWGPPAPMAAIPALPPAYTATTSPHETPPA